MGKRKYIYLALLVFMIGCSLYLYHGNQSYDYSCPVRTDKPIAILVYGKYPSATVPYVKNVVESVFRVKTEVIYVGNATPRAAYNYKKGKYNAGTVLAVAGEVLGENYLKGLVLVDEDIYGPSSNFVLGLASGDNRVAVISVDRYQISLGGFLLERNFYRKILRTLIVHELGHTFGLEHCENDCAMQFSNNILKVILESDRYCDQCQVKVRAFGLTTKKITDPSADPAFSGADTGQGSDGPSIQGVYIHDIPADPANTR